MSIIENADDVCEDLLLDLIGYELCCGRLSPEMKYLLEMHLEQCASCRRRILSYLNLLSEDKAMRNFG
jgi:hypothetical protein